MAQLQEWAKQLQDIVWLSTPGEQAPSVLAPFASALWGLADSGGHSNQLQPDCAGQQPSAAAAAGVERLLLSMQQRAQHEQVAAAAAEGGGGDDGEAHLAGCSVPQCRRCAYEHRLQERRYEQRRRLQERQRQLQAMPLQQAQRAGLL